MQNLNPLKYRLHPEDTEALETVNAIFRETAADLQAAALEHTSLVESFEQLKTKAQESLKKSQQQQKELRDKAAQYCHYCNKSWGFDSIRPVEAGRELIVFPVTHIAFLSSEPHLLQVQINGERRSLLPLNSEENGPKIVSRFQDYAGSGQVIFLQGPIRSAELLSPSDIEDIKILLGRPLGV